MTRGRPVSRPADAEETWRHYRAELHRFVSARVHDDVLAEDIVHDALVRAYSSRGTLEHPAKLRGWLYRITRNTIADHFRAKTRDRAIAGEMPVPLADSHAAAGSAVDDADDAARDLAVCLGPIVETLGARDREALRLTEVDGLTQREVSEKLGISLSGAKSRVQRARRRLADAVLRCCRVELDRRGGVIDYEPRPEGTCC